MNTDENYKALESLAIMVHENAVNKGFHPLHEPIEVFVANQCNNIHGEVQELWDSWRAGTQNNHCDKPIPLSQTEEELADIVIRALDVSVRLGVDIGLAVKLKHEYNLTRPHKHGKKN